MFLAIRTVRVLWIAAAIAGALFGAVAIVAALFPGKRAFWDAYKYWLVGLPVALFIWAAGEQLGLWLSRSAFLNSLSSPVRITLAVLGLVAVIAVVAAVRWGIQRYAL
jgi:hypothetical protein